MLCGHRGERACGWVGGEEGKRAERASGGRRKSSCQSRSREKLARTTWNGQEWQGSNRGRGERRVVAKRVSRDLTAGARQRKSLWYAVTRQTGRGNHGRQLRVQPPYALHLPLRASLPAGRTARKMELMWRQHVAMQCGRRATPRQVKVKPRAFGTAARTRCRLCHPGALRSTAQRRETRTTEGIAGKGGRYKGGVVR